MKKKQVDDFIQEDDHKGKTDLFMKWQELKPIGKNIHRRSYHSCVVWEQFLYIYGGYEANEGILDDLVRIPMPSSGKQLSWNTLYVASEERKMIPGPGPLRNHAAVSHKGMMYIVGGKDTLINTVGQLWIYDFEEGGFIDGGSLLYNKQTAVVEGHNFCVWEAEDKLIIFGGFYGDWGYLASVIQYENEQWTVLYDGKQNSLNAPKGRAGSGAVIISNDLFIFGGNDGEMRYGDFWRFNLQTHEWTLIITERSPGTRSSTVLLPHPQGILLFGGIHDITHEKNDLWLYKNEWVLLEEDNSRRQNNEELNDSAFDKASMGIPRKQKVKGDQTRSFLNEADQISPKRGSLKHIQIPQKQLTDTVNSSSMNNMDEQKKKKWKDRKKKMLDEFEMTEEEKAKFRCSSPTTEQIRHSLQQIMNQDKSSITRKIQSPEKRLSTQLQGKKPCARDGHSAVVVGEYMVVFGGDRNLMSFNDIYSYNLGK